MGKCLLNSLNSVTILTDRRRNCNIDLIRIIACAAVVGLHTFSKDLSVVTASLYYLCGFAVPFFFMTSGYFLLNRGYVDANYSFHRTIVVFRIVFCWNAISVVFKLIKQLLIGEEITVGWLTIPLECVKSLVQKGNMWQFWYMGALLIICLMLPTISRFSKKGKRVLIAFAGVIAVAFEIISIVSGSPVQASIIQTFRIWTWVFYFVLGSEMGRITEILVSKINVRLHIVIAIAFTIINIVYQNYAGVYLIAPDNGMRLHAEYFYDSLLEIVWIIVIFTLLLRVNISDSIRIIVERVASLTMGIYIIHPLLMRITVKIIGNTSLIRVFIYWIVTLFGSALVTWVFSKTVMKKYLLNV